MPARVHKPVLIIVAGPNGAGKTTVTRQLRVHEWLEDAVYINPDDVAKNKFGDWNSDDAVRKAAEYCAEWREQCLRNHESLMFETVFSAQDKLDFLQRAIQEGFFVRLFFVCTASPHINASRVAKRVMEGGHSVPIPKIISRYQKSIANCLVASQMANRTYVYDNSIDGEKASLLFRLTDGRLKKKYCEDIPQWAVPILVEAASRER